MAPVMKFGERLQQADATATSHDLGRQSAHSSGALNIAHAPAAADVQLSCAYRLGTVNPAALRAAWCMHECTASAARCVRLWQITAVERWGHALTRVVPPHTPPGVKDTICADGSTNPGASEALVNARASPLPPTAAFRAYQGEQTRRGPVMRDVESGVHGATPPRAHRIFTRIGTADITCSRTVSRGPVRGRALRRRRWRRPRLEARNYCADASARREWRAPHAPARRLRDSFSVSECTAHGKVAGAATVREQRTVGALLAAQRTATGGMVAHADE